MSNAWFAIAAFLCGLALLVIGGIVGFLLAPIIDARKDRGEDVAAARTLKPYDRYLAEKQPGDVVPVAREVQKEIVPSGKVFGKLEYEDIQLKFLDNFLLKYFHSIMFIPDDFNAGVARSPWKAFCAVNDWANGMPELFWLMAGYKPDEYQLNSAISEYARRVNLSKAVNK
jgi:hypothetical protein